MSRLEFAPKLKEIQITDIRKGIGAFTPKPEKEVSFLALQTALKKAGYKLDSAEITVAGKLEREGSLWWLVAQPSRERFLLEASNLDEVLAHAAPGDEIEITGGWKTVGADRGAREVISPRVSSKAGGARNSATLGSDPSDKDARLGFEKTDFLPAPALVFENSSLVAAPLAPIRTTSPGLTVYKGGAIVPRLYFIEQHVGNVEVSRQVLVTTISYTPTQRLQLEAEVPSSRTAFTSGTFAGSGGGLGNVILWTKYRFYRAVKIYGDRQAAIKFGLETPTGDTTAPGQQALNSSAYVRQQLTPINGGLAPHLDLNFSQAQGRVIWGGSGEDILRFERAGYRTGHEVRLNSDLEYVLLPRNYPAPGGELFAILESNFVSRGTGRSGGLPVPGSRSTEYFVSPGLQYAAATRFVVEGSFQFPIFRNAGPEALRTDRSLLLGVRYLF